MVPIMNKCKQIYIHFAVLQKPADSCSAGSEGKFQLYVF